MIADPPDTGYMRLLMAYRAHIPLNGYKIAWCFHCMPGDWDFCAHYTFTEYEQNLMLRSAVERQFEIIGEALHQAEVDDSELRTYYLNYVA